MKVYLIVGAVPIKDSETWAFYIETVHVIKSKKKAEKILKEYNKKNSKIKKAFGYKEFWVEEWNVE